MSEQAALELARHAAEMSKQQHERELQRLARLWLMKPILPTLASAALTLLAPFTFAAEPASRFGAISV